MQDTDRDVSPSASEEPEERDTHSGARLCPPSVAADRAGVSRRTVDRWVSSGRLQDLGDAARGRRVRLDEVERLASEARRLDRRGRRQPEDVSEATEVRVRDLETQLAALSEDRDQWRTQAASLVLALQAGPDATLRAEVDTLRAQLEDARLEVAHADRELAVLRDRLERRRSWWPWGR